MKTELKRPSSLLKLTATILAANAIMGCGDRVLDVTSLSGIKPTLKVTSKNPFDTTNGGTELAISGVCSTDTIGFRLTLGLYQLNIQNNVVTAPGNTSSKQILADTDCSDQTFSIPLTGENISVFTSFYHAWENYRGSSKIEVVALTKDTTSNIVILKNSNFYKSLSPQIEQASLTQSRDGFQVLTKKLNNTGCNEIPITGYDQEGSPMEFSLRDISIDTEVRMNNKPSLNPLDYSINTSPLQNIVYLDSNCTVLFSSVNETTDNTKRLKQLIYVKPMSINVDSIVMKTTSLDSSISSEGHLEISAETFGKIKVSNFNSRNQIPTETSGTSGIYYNKFEVSFHGLDLPRTMNIEISTYEGSIHSINLTQIPNSLKQVKTNVNNQIVSSSEKTYFYIFSERVTATTVLVINVTGEFGTINIPLTIDPQ